jgi:hypothetical protein
MGHTMRDALMMMQMAHAAGAAPFIDDVRHLTHSHF